AGVDGILVDVEAGTAGMQDVHGVLLVPRVGRQGCGQHVALRTPRGSGGNRGRSGSLSGSGFTAGSLPPKDERSQADTEASPSLHDLIFMGEGVATPHEGFTLFHVVSFGRGEGVSVKWNETNRRARS